MRGVAETDPKLFLSPVARLLPAETSIELNQNFRLDMSTDMREAEKRLSAARRVEHDSGELVPLLHHGRADELG